MAATASSAGPLGARVARRRVTPARFMPSQVPSEVDAVHDVQPLAIYDYGGAVDVRGKLYVANRAIRDPRVGLYSGVCAHSRRSFLDLLPSRARYVLNDLIGESSGRKGVIVSDRHSVYAYLGPECRQVCWAHLVRDFTRIAQRRGQDGRIGQRLLGLACVMFCWRAQARAAEGCAALQRRLQSALQRGASQTECSRTAKTCQSVLRIWPGLLWSLLRNSEVPPTSNAAEQALRSIVLKRKISGPTRSRRGEEFLAHAYTVFEPCRRQRRDLLSFIHHAVVAWIDKTPTSSLVSVPAASGKKASPPPPRRPTARPLPGEGVKNACYQFQSGVALFERGYQGGICAFTLTHTLLTWVYSRIASNPISRP